ncbi:hypothetical protein ACS0TY_027156 [Phlomoides rotata]
MEVVVTCNTSACLDISNSGGSATDTHHLSQYDSKDLSMNELQTCLTEILNIETIGTSTNGLSLSPEKNDIGNVVKEHEHKGSHKNTTCSSASEKCLSKCATFPPLHEPKSAGEREKHEETITAEVSEINGSTKPLNKCYSRSISLPAPSKVVPAIKGSREKQGIPPKKLSVTWAPDVYDPIPTSVSHVPSNKNRSNGKKSGKYKHKGSGKSSRGSKGKDKKQVRKNGGGSTKLKPFHEDCGVGFGDAKVGNADFDPFCGSSFLKNSVTNLHFPVAEAT